MKILALDLATQLGYAYGNIGTKPKHGTTSLHNSKWDGAGVRYVKFKAWLLQVLFSEKVELVIYEGVRRHTGTDAAHIYGAWVAILQAECERLEIPYTAFGVTEIKKFWTGSGNAKKDAMMQGAYDRGFDPKDDNAADALAIWHMGAEAYGEL